MIIKPENFSKPPQKEILPKKENEKKPHYIIMITRHAERLPSGELSPEGIIHAKTIGEKLKHVEVLKPYTSDHPSGRTHETAEYISKEANVKSPLSGERYQTRKIKGIQYDLLNPEILKDVKLLIEERTLEEINNDHPELSQVINSMVTNDKDGLLTKVDSKGEIIADIEKLPKDIQQRIAPIRQKNQNLGFEKMFNDPQTVQNMAAGLSHQIYNKELLLKRYSKSREKKEKEPKDDIIVNLNTHGLFTESLLKNAGIHVKPNGEEIHGIENIDDGELGGYIQPAESIYLDLGQDSSNIPERIPVIFEETRDIKGKIYIDKVKLEQLSKYYDQNIKK